MYPSIQKSFFRLHVRLFFLIFMPLVLLLPAAAKAVDGAAPAPSYTTIQAGHSAMWYDPARSGEGWMLEVLPDDGAVVYWFTFDEEGAPRWLTAGGTIVRSENGDEIRFDSLIAVHGPQFGPEFDPADAVREDKGSAIFRFHDCDSGEIHFDAYGRQGSFALTRLTRTMGTSGCRPIHGTPGEPVQPYAGQSGSWYDPAYSGQGYSLGWMANGDAALVWFTFDSEGQPYWLTAIGKAEGEQIIFPELFAVHGGRFADDFDPADVVRTSWGRLEMTLDCDAGQAVYQPTEAGFAAGEFDLRRLTRLQDPACPWVKPKLADLYDFEWTELPVPAYTTPLSPVNFEMTSIADDGTVVGRGHWNGWRGIVRLKPGETEWEKMLENAKPGQNVAFITPDGKTIYAEYEVPPPPEETVRTSHQQLLMWRESTGWKPLQGVVYPINSLNGISQNGKWLTGRSFATNGDRPYAWRWSEETGQVTMDDWGTPMGISDDGITAVGTMFLGTRWATMWVNDKMKFLYDGSGIRLGVARLCNSDCSFMAGFYQYPLNTLDAHRAWYRTRSGAVTYLDMPEGAFDTNVMDMSRNGDLIAGIQAVWEESHGRLIAEGWLWTEDTGPVSMRDILEGEGEFQFTNRWNRHINAVSSDGTRILFSGIQWAPPGRSSLSQYRAGVLRLIPKASMDASHQREE